MTAEKLSKLKFDLQIRGLSKEFLYNEMLDKVYNDLGKKVIGGVNFPKYQIKIFEFIFEVPFDFESDVIIPINSIGTFNFDRWIRFNNDRSLIFEDKEFGLLIATFHKTYNIDSLSGINPFRIAFAHYNSEQNREDIINEIKEIFNPKVCLD